MAKISISMPDDSENLGTWQLGNVHRACIQALQRLEDLASAVKRIRVDFRRSSQKDWCIRIDVIIVDPLGNETAYGISSETLSPRPSMGVPSQETLRDYLCLPDVLPNAI